MKRLKIKEQVLQLRRQGKTYSEITRELERTIPKSTIATWCSGVVLPEKQVNRINKLSLLNLKKARDHAWLVRQKKREELLQQIDNQNRHSVDLLRDKRVAKLALALLYLAEGSKSKRASLMFGNSDPEVIRLFMALIRSSFDVKEDKIRITVQCRADQDELTLRKFWSKVTKIPLRQFYKSQIDKRTLGKPSRKLNYKGVCRIDYFSSITDLELKRIVVLISKYFLGR